MRLKPGERAQLQPPDPVHPMRNNSAARLITGKARSEARLQPETFFLTRSCSKMTQKFSLQTLRPGPWVRCVGDSISICPLVPPNQDIPKGPEVPVPRPSSSPSAFSARPHASKSTALVALPSRHPDSKDSSRCPHEAEALVEVLVAKRTEGYRRFAGFCAENPGPGKHRRSGPA